MKLKQFQRIEIFWLDSIHTNGWKWIGNLDLNDAHLEHRTIGYFLEETNKAISVCESFKEKREKDGDVCVDAVMTIPKKAILKINKL